MPSPFPGMDPYLEHPHIWQGLHNRLIVAIANEISAQLAGSYYVDIQQRVYLNEAEEPTEFRIPDVSVLNASGNGDAPTSSLDAAFAESEDRAVAVKVPIPEEVRETYLEVREGGSDYLITAIELLSPTNKRRGRGRQLYEDKRMEMLGTRTNLVEIDLLRAGEPMRLIGNGIHSDYRILVARGGKSIAMLYPSSECVSASRGSLYLCAAMMMNQSLTSVDCCLTYMAAPDTICGWTTPRSLRRRSPAQMRYGLMLC